MKPELIFFLLILFFGQSTLAQKYFEGKIYSEQISADPLIPLKSIIYSQSGSNYKKETYSDSVLISASIYVGEENRLYSRYGDSIIIWNDHSKPYQDKILFQSIVENTDTLLGYQCDRLTIVTKNDSSIYFISDDLIINPDTYRNNKNLFEERMKLSSGRYPIASVHFPLEKGGERSPYKVIPIKIDRMELSALEFKVDNSKTLVPSSLLLDEPLILPTIGIEKFYKKLSKKLKYPKMDRMNGIEGKVFLLFVVDEKGNTSMEHVLKGPTQTMNDAVIEAFRKIDTKWQIPTLKGKPTKASVIIPVTFKFNQ